MEASERSQNVPSSQTSYGITIIKECGGHALLVRGQRAVRPLIFHWATEIEPLSYLAVAKLLVYRMS